MADPIKIQIQEKVSGNSVQTYHPETEASIVKFDDPSSNGAWGNNVQDAIELVIADLGDIRANIGDGTGVVTGVKGNAESTYRAGQVNITPSNIGAYSTSEIDQKIGVVLEQQNIVATTANEAKTIAEGRARAVVFDTESDMTSYLKRASNTEFKIGDNLFIRQFNVPDYWVSKVLSSNAGTYGYYEISLLETQKVDLASYQTKEDSTLKTTSKTIVGAINEVNDYAGWLDGQNESRTSEIENIISGVQVVGKATNSTNADNATKANQLTTARNIVLDGDVSGSASFNGTSDITIQVALDGSGVTAGYYSAVEVTSKGIVKTGKQFIEIAELVDDTPSDDLAIGGIFFKRIE